MADEENIETPPANEENGQESQPSEDRPETAKSKQEVDNETGSRTGSAKSKAEEGGDDQPPKSALSRAASTKSSKSVKSAKSVAWSTADSDKALIEEDEEEKKGNLCARIISGMVKKYKFLLKILTATYCYRNVGFEGNVER